MWVEEAGEVRKKFGSQKEIVSCTVGIGGRYVNLDEEGGLNCWHKDSEEGASLNPESYEYITDPDHDP